MLVSTILPLLALIGGIAASPTPLRQGLGPHKKRACAVRPRPQGPPTSVIDNVHVVQPTVDASGIHIGVGSGTGGAGQHPGGQRPGNRPPPQGPGGPPPSPPPPPPPVQSPPAPPVPTGPSAAPSSAADPAPVPSTPPSSISPGAGAAPETSPSPAPSPRPAPPPAPAPRGDKHVFAHFMVGIVSAYDAAAWEYDMSIAQAAGITGFALNIGTDAYNQQQLDLAYAAGAKLGFDLFISFDFNWFGLGDAGRVTELLGRYADHPAQLLVDGKVFVSTFIGDGFNWNQVAQGIGKELYTVPFYQPRQEFAARDDFDGLFSWAAWPGQLDNQPIRQNMTLLRDEEYMSALGSAGKTYMAPVSPWFSTHFGHEVPYAKNWVFYSELLWKTRWDQILQMGPELNFIEIITWNDYGESHHIGPYNTPHTDDGSSKWNDGLDHLAMLEMSKPYIAAFKAGLSAPVITEDRVVYWYRPHLKSAQCDATDNCGGRPTGWEMLDDSVFVTVLSVSGGTVTVTSGGNTPFTRTVPEGVTAFSVPMGVGEQHFAFEAAGQQAEGTSDVDISAECWNGIYNYNFHSGTIVV